MKIRVIYGLLCVVNIADVIRILTFLIKVQRSVVPSFKAFTAVFLMQVETPPAFQKL